MDFLSSDYMLLECLIENFSISDEWKVIANLFLHDWNVVVEDPFEKMCALESVI